MRESVIYQEIIREGRQEGRQQGRQEGRQEGELALILRQLIRRFGTLPPEMQAQIRELSTAQLEDLGEALLDFSEAADLAAWLQRHSGL